MLVPPNVPTPQTGLEFLPGKLPSVRIPKDADLESIAKGVLKGLPDIPDGWFTSDCFWRDQLTLTSTFRTIYGGDRARATWLHLAKSHHPTGFKHIDTTTYIAELGGDNNRYIFSAFTFQTSRNGLAATHSGYLNIVPGSKEGTWQVWCLQTLLEGFKGYELHDLRRVYPDEVNDEFPETDIGLATNRNYRDYIQKQSTQGVNDDVNCHVNGFAKGLDREPAIENNVRRVDVIVVGGGQAGLATAGFCKAAELDTLIVEKYKAIGDNWTERYASLYLHTPHRWNDLPFGPTFNSREYSEWLSAAELKKGYQAYVNRYNIDVWTSSKIVNTEYDTENNEWHLQIDQNSQTKEVVAKHIVLCTGSGGTRPLRPNIPGQEHFKGHIMHSVDWKHGKDYKGKKGIVIGTANTGHDMAENMLDAGLSSVTMVQRGATYVIPRDFMTMFLDFAFPPNKTRSVDNSDRLFWSMPLGASRHMCSNFFNPMIEQNKKHFDGLKAAGFKLDTSGDFMENLIVRNGGHFMVGTNRPTGLSSLAWSAADLAKTVQDHGASAKVAAGLIKIKSDSTIAAYTPNGLEFADGSVLEADLVVYATGFEKDIGESSAGIVGEKIAASLLPFWGVNEEGEQRGLGVPNGWPNLWLIGGGCGSCRYFPRYVALQIQADKLGHPLVPYTDTLLTVE